MVALYLIVGMASAGAVALLCLYHGKSLKMTSSTMGRIVQVEEREVRDEHERRDDTLVVCRYVVARREYALEQVLRGRQARRFPVGRQVEVRYNPASPEMARIDVR